jgi:GT2 family glycosyltransferase
MPSVCLAVLNYNGRKHLEHLLPTASAAAKNYPGKCSIVVLDNRSTDPDVEWVKANYPAVEIIVAPKNDFLYSYNWLAEKRSEDILVFLNNDLRLHPQFLAPLVQHLERPDVFSVSACSYDWEGKEFTSGPVRLSQKHGFYAFRFDTARQERCHTMFTSGGFMAVDRRKFLDLDGFNPLFYPAYCEDVDLCFRAWRRGWRSVYEPDSVVWHREHASWADSPLSNTNRLHSRNALLFQWASLPMHQTRWMRRYSFAKIMYGALRRGDFKWFGDFYSTAVTWFLWRKKYSWMKASQAELDLICAHIGQPCQLPSKPTSADVTGCLSQKA